MQVRMYLTKENFNFDAFASNIKVIRRVFGNPITKEWFFSNKVGKKVLQSTQLSKYIWGCVVLLEKS